MQAPTTGLSSREKLSDGSTEYKLSVAWSGPKGKRMTMLVRPDYVSTPLGTAQVETKSLIIYWFIYAI